MFLRRVLFVSLACICFSAMLSSPAHAAWWDIFFPAPSKGPNPAETLRAPFANTDAVIEDLDASGNARNATPLELRHRPNDVITTWVQGTVPLLISYKIGEGDIEYRKKSRNFSMVGSKEYLAFLTDRNFFKVLDTGRFDIQGFIQDTPIIVNEGAVDGSYKWLYRCNIMVTYLEKGTDYKADFQKKGEVDVVSQEYVLQFQIGRSHDATNENGILIETWSVRPKK